MMFKNLGEASIGPVLEVMKRSAPQSRIDRARARLAIRRAKRAAERPQQAAAPAAPQNVIPQEFADGGYVGPRRSPQDYGKKKK